MGRKEEGRKGGGALAHERASCSKRYITNVTPEHSNVGHARNVNLHVTKQEKGEEQPWATTTTVVERVERLPWQADARPATVCTKQRVFSIPTVMDEAAPVDLEDQHAWAGRWIFVIYPWTSGDLVLRTGVQKSRTS